MSNTLFYAVRHSVFGVSGTGFCRAITTESAFNDVFDAVSGTAFCRAITTGTLTGTGNIDGNDNLNEN